MTLSSLVIKHDIRSVVNKASDLKAKAKAQRNKAKAKAKDLSFKAKAKAKNLSLKAKAKAKANDFVSEVHGTRSKEAEMW